MYCNLEAWLLKKYLDNLSIFYTHTQTLVVSQPIKLCMTVKTGQISPPPPHQQHIQPAVVDIQKAPFVEHTIVEQNCQVYSIAISCKHMRSTNTRDVVDLMKTAKVNAYIMYIFGKFELLSIHET